MREGSTPFSPIKGYTLPALADTEVRERALGTPEICVGYAADLVWYTITERLVTESYAPVVELADTLDPKSNIERCTSSILVRSIENT